MKFEYWFPTVTGIHYVPEDVKSKTRTKVDEWIDQDKHKQYLENCGIDNLTTSYFRWHDTLGDLNLTELHDEMKTAAIEFALCYGLPLTKDDIKVDSWINFFYPNQSEQQHNHYGNFLSGVYYVTAPEKSGAYAFFDPAVQKTMWKGQYLSKAAPNMTNFNDGQYQPEEGKIIMFPSWLEHAVYANKSNDVRISIAFNVNMVKQ
jgi:uncharacterized protein (TIGR02466 family)